MCKIKFKNVIIHNCLLVLGACIPISNPFVKPLETSFHFRIWGSLRTFDTTFHNRYNTKYKQPIIFSFNTPFRGRTMTPKTTPSLHLWLHHTTIDLLARNRQNREGLYSGSSCNIIIGTKDWLRPGPVVLTGGAVALGPQIVGAPSCIRCVYTKLLRSKC